MASILMASSRLSELQSPASPLMLYKQRLLLSSIIHGFVDIFRAEQVPLWGLQRFLNLWGRLATYHKIITDRGLKSMVSCYRSKDLSLGL